MCLSVCVCVLTCVHMCLPLTYASWLFYLYLPRVSSLGISRCFSYIISMHQISCMLLAKLLFVKIIIHVGAFFHKDVKLAIHIMSCLRGVFEKTSLNVIQ